jgi:hypothetical protein
MALKRIMVDLNLPVIFYPVHEFNLSNNNKRADIVLVLDTDMTIGLFCQDLFDDFSFRCW